jgi:hypothetical protein
MALKLGLTLREEYRLKELENRVLRRIFGTKRDDVAKSREDCVMRSFISCMLHQILLG